MNNETEVTTVMMGGAMATLLLWLFGPTIVAWHGGEPVPVGIESAFAVLCTCILAWFLPPKLLSRIRRRTGPHQHHEKPLQLPEDKK